MLNKIKLFSDEFKKGCVPGNSRSDKKGDTYVSSYTIYAIAANFGTARPTVSKHLQILTECELLEQEQNGREIHYHFNPDKMKEVADFIEPFRNMWDDRFNKLETIMKNYKSKK